MKPELKFADGKLIVTVQQNTDFDKDTKASASVDLTVEIDAYEAVTEIAKKDIPLLEMIIKALKVN